MRTYASPSSLSTSPSQLSRHSVAGSLVCALFPPEMWAEKMTFVEKEILLPLVLILYHQFGYTSQGRCRMPRKARPRARKVDLSTGSLVGSAGGRAVWFMRDDGAEVV